VGAFSSSRGVMAFVANFNDEINQSERNTLWLTRLSASIVEIAGVAEATHRIVFPLSIRSE
jgi:hypothetical protein